MTEPTLEPTLIRADGAESRQLCPGCDVEPPADFAGPNCPSCGSMLVKLVAPVDPMIGQTIDGRFEIRGEIGRGGMGSVYRAWQKSVGREVAIKIIHERHAGD